jgi:hypothetical protein
VVCIPIPRCTPGSAVHDKVLRPFGNFVIEVVHQHAHGSFLLPPFAGKQVATRCADGSAGLNFSFNGHD